MFKKMNKMDGIPTRLVKVERAGEKFWQISSGKINIEVLQILI